MRLLPFLLCLCSLFLPAAGAGVLASPPDGTHIYSPFQHASRHAAIARSHTSQTLFSVVDEPYFAIEAEDLLDDNVEDSDPSANDQADFPDAQTGGYSYPSYASLLRHNSNCFRDSSLPISGKLSDRYLLLGVLRI